MWRFKHHKPEEQISFENKNIDFVFGKCFYNHYLKVRAGAFKSEKKIYN
jgi:hypothetical protein